MKREREREGENARPESGKRGRRILPLQVAKMIAEKYCDRDREIRELVEHLHEENLRIPGLVVAGPSGTGKSSIVRDVLAGLDIPFAYLCPAECSEEGILLQTVIHQVSRWREECQARSTGQESVITIGRKKSKISSSNEYLEKRKKNLEDIHLVMQSYGLGQPSPGPQVIEEKTMIKVSPKERFCIVLDGAEDLQRIHKPSLISAFCRLPELSKRNVWVIYICEKVIPGLQDAVRQFRIPVAEFTPYSSASTLKQILKKIHNTTTSRPSKRQDDENHLRNNEVGEEELFHKFVEEVVPLVWPTYTRNLKELLFIKDALFPGILKQFRNFILGDEDLPKAQAISRAIKWALEPCRVALVRSIGHHELGGALSSLDSKNPSSSSSLVAKTSSPAIFFTPPIKVELPFQSKILVLAAYIASYTKAEDDIKVFGLRGGKITRSSNKLTGAASSAATSVNADRDVQLLDQVFQGPRVFELERLLWIFRSLLVEMSGEEVALDAFNDSVYRQIASLEKLHLLTKVTRNGDLSEVRYKCVVEEKYAFGLAKNLNIRLENYLIKKN